MKKGIVILLLCMLQICPVMASDRDDQRPTYVPGDEEVGGTIYGSLSGRPLGEEPNPDPTPDPDPTPNPDPTPDPDPIPNPNPIPNGNPNLGYKEQGQSKDTTGTNTGDTSKFFLWIILFAGAYIVLRVYNGKREEG